MFYGVICYHVIGVCQETVSRGGRCTCCGYTAIISDGWTGEVKISRVGDFESPRTVGIAGSTGRGIAHTIEVLSVNTW